MFRPMSRNEELFEFLNTAVEEDGIKARLLTVMARLSEDQWELLADMAETGRRGDGKGGPGINQVRL